MTNQNILRKSVAIGLAAAALTAGSNAFAAGNKGSITVLNWWTSGSEAKSMNVLQQMLAKQGYKMVNDAVSGGGGGNARTVLKSRIQSNNVPGAAQIKGPSIQQWCQTGLTANIDSVAKKDHWSKILPTRVAKGMKCNGHWVAVPFNIHRINWLWINRADMKKAGAKMPHTWPQLVEALKKLKKAGITPMAGGGDTWQVGTEFDAIAIATGGGEFYRNAFVKLEPSALSSDTMAKVFSRLRTVEKYTDPNGNGLSWNHDAGMVVNGKAAMQIMGDWAKGTISIDGATPGKQVACMVMPGEHAGFVYNTDSFEMFKNSTANQAVRQAFAQTVLSPQFQRRFNMAKGSIPVRTGVSLKGFDQCAKKSNADFKKAEKNNAVVPSMSQNMAEIDSVQGAIFDTIAKFYNDSSMTPKAAAAQLAQQVKQAKEMSQS